MVIIKMMNYSLNNKDIKILMILVIKNIRVLTLKIMDIEDKKLEMKKS